MANTSTGALVEIHAEWWGEDENVVLQPVKTYFMQVRAQSKASVIPDGYTAEQLREMSQTEMAKLDMYDPGRYHESLFKDMIVSSTLRFPTEVNEETGEEILGDVIPKANLLENIPEEDGKFIADEIVKLGKGRREASKNKQGLDFRSPA